MSSRKLELALTARQDLKDFVHYSERRWSADLADAYTERLYEGLETIRAFPMVGKEREGLRPSTRVFAVEEHIVVYTIAENTVRILRIVHKRTDWTLED